MRPRNKSSPAIHHHPVDRTVCSALGMPRRRGPKGHHQDEKHTSPDTGQPARHADAPEYSALSKHRQLHVVRDLRRTLSVGRGSKPHPTEAHISNRERVADSLLESFLPLRKINTAARPSSAPPSTAPCSPSSKPPAFPHRASASPGSQPCCNHPQPAPSTVPPNPPGRHLLAPS